MPRTHDLAIFVPTTTTTTTTTDRQTIDSRRGKGTGNVHIILYNIIGKVWHMFSLVQFCCIGIFNTFSFCSFYELFMAFFWPKLSIEHSVANTRIM